MAGFWREFAGGFSQNSKDDNENVMKPEFDGNVEGSIKKEYVRDENLIVGPESEEKHIVLENDNGEGEIKANIFEESRLVTISKKFLRSFGCIISFVVCQKIHTE